MFLRLSVNVLLCVCVPATVIAQSDHSTRKFSHSAVLADNPELEKIFISDQEDRGNYSFAKPGDPRPSALTGLQVRHNDDARELRVRQLLDTGYLHTAKDYYRCALIFQHSPSPSGYLLAHILADIAISRGNADAMWLSAATLDRYLLSVKQPQVFGTQFSATPDPSKKGAYTFDQNDFNSSLITDSMRVDLCVKPLAEQKQGLPGPPAGTSLYPCPVAQMLKPLQKP